MKYSYHQVFLSSNLKNTMPTEGSGWRTPLQEAAQLRSRGRKRVCGDPDRSSHFSGPGLEGTRPHSGEMGTHVYFVRTH